MVVELVSVVLAEVVADAGLVSLPVVEVEVDDAVAAVLGVQGVIIHARGMDVLSEVGVGVVLADGLVDVVLYIGVDVYGDADVDVGKAVANVAGISGVTESRGGDGIL